MSYFCSGCLFFFSVYCFSIVAIEISYMKFLSVFVAISVFFQSAEECVLTVLVSNFLYADNINFRKNVIIFLSYLLFHFEYYCNIYTKHTHSFFLSYFVFYRSDHEMRVCRTSPNKK